MGVLAMMLLGALASKALFTSASTIGPHELKAGTLEIKMTVDQHPESDFSLLPDGPDWLPGDHREAVVTLTNTGSLPSRWRLGVVPKSGYSPALVDELVLSFYREDTNGDWKVFRSEPLEDYLIKDNQGGWLYDSDLLKASGRSFIPVQPGEQVKMVMQIDFELSAADTTPAQMFEGNLFLQAAQVNDQNWFPTDQLNLQVEGGE